MAHLPNIPSIPRPNIAMPALHMPQVSMPSIPTPSMIQMPSMPARLEVLRTPGKFLANNRPRMPKFDISRSIDSLKNYMPSYRANQPAQPEAIPEEPPMEGQSNEAPVVQPRAQAAPSLVSASSEASFFTLYVISIWDSI